MTADWINIDPLSGGTGITNVTVSVTDNTNIGVIKYANIRFSNEEGMSQMVKIKQNAPTDGLNFSLAPYALTFQTSGETLTGSVLSNSKWFVTEYPDWITVTSDKTDNIGSATLYIAASPNTGNDERDGFVKIVSLGEEKSIYVVQPSYTSLKVEPKLFRYTGVTAETIVTSITVTSSADWEIRNYDEKYFEFSSVSGHSGVTTVEVTLKNIPKYARTLGVPFIQTFEVTDHLTSHTVKFELSESESIDDDAVTVTYNLSSAGSFLGFKYNICDGCPAWSYELQDDFTIWAYETTKIEQVGMNNACLNMRYVYFYASTPGRHTIKYRSNQYSTPYGVFEKNKDIESVVFGNQNNGGIAEYTFWESSVSKISLGTGTHTIYNYAFGKCYLGNMFYLPETCTLNGAFSSAFYSTRAGTFFYCLTDSIGGQGSTSSGKGNGRAGGGASCDHWYVWSSKYGGYSYSAKTGSLPVEYDRMIIQKNISHIGQMNGCSISTFTCSKVENKESKEYVVFNQGHYAGRISTIIFMGDTAPQFYTTGTSTSSISYRNDGSTTSTRTDSVSPNPMTVYYPEGGTNYTTNWSRSFVTLHSYRDLDDIFTE